MKPTKSKAAGAKGRGGSSGVDPGVYARGLKLRAELTGAKYVKGADTDLDPALVPVRELLTEWMWGKVWTRKGIDRRTRSFMNIGILVALNRPHELAVNLRMAVKNGLSRAEIGEAILHAAAYCGVPAGINSIGVANEFFKREDQDRGTAALSAKRRAGPRQAAAAGGLRSRKAV